MRKIFLAVVVVAAILASVLSVATRAEDASPLDTMGSMAAHRGGAALYPENTLTAFKNIHQDMPDVILEMDVRGLKDGTLVIWHDATVDRNTNATGKVADMTKAQWANLRVNGPGGTAPATTLQEVLDEFAGTDVPMFIELKDTTVTDKFIETLHPHREQIVAASFKPDIASRLARSGFHTMQLSTPPVEPVDGVEYVGFSNSRTTKQYVDAHPDVKVWAWGDDVTVDMAESDQRGLAGFIANNPRGS